MVIGIRKIIDTMLFFLQPLLYALASLDYGHVFAGRQPYDAVGLIGAKSAYLARFTDTNDRSLADMNVVPIHRLQ